MFDLVVLGGGPAGYTGAIRAAKLGMSVALVEKSELGGTCLNRGCIPTKVLLHSSQLFESRDSWADMGISAENVTVDENLIYARKESVTSSLRAGIEMLIKANKIAYYNAFGKIIDKNHILAGEETLETKYILIATGSSPARLPIDGIENALTSDDVLSAPVEGNKIAIIGGGVIGMEFAGYFAGIGKEVTVIEAMDRITPMMSKEISIQLGQVLKKSGVTILTSSKVLSIKKDGVIIENKGTETEITADCVIVAIGRKPNIDGIGLEEAGVEKDRFIKADDNMMTSVSNIYAAGDCNGKLQLAHFAEASAIKAVSHMAGKECGVDLSVCPSCIYTSPEVASVGAKEGAKQGKFLLGSNGRSIINGVNRGFVKIIADEEDTVIGAELFGSNVTEMIGELALAVKNKLKVADIADTIHAHPTVHESIMEAAEDIYGLATNKK
ncbi:MAG: dihydrolipoyl dehydrogenase [Clostridia bacterium]|nr:dihydrolipoyl dehydrogenase [Clostridia bacterium]